MTDYLQANRFLSMENSINQLLKSDHLSLSPPPSLILWYCSLHWGGGGYQPCRGSYSEPL